MTLAQAATILDASPKWVQNAFATLGRPLAYREAEVRRLGLARRLSTQCGVAFPAAWRLAGEALRRAAEGIVRFPGDGVTVIELDVRRYLSDWAAVAARVRELAPPRGRGRPRRPPSRERRAVAAASRYGIDIPALVEGLKRTPAQRLLALEENWRFVRGLRPQRRRA